MLIWCDISVKNPKSTIFQLVHLNSFDMYSLDFLNEVNLIDHRSENVQDLKYEDGITELLRTLELLASQNQFEKPNIAL